MLPADAGAERRALRERLGADELVLVTTCNRVELHLVAGAVRAPDELLARARAFFAGRGAAAGAAALEAWSGRAAVERLLGVACGLDSLVLGETEIAGAARARPRGRPGRGAVRPGPRPAPRARRRLLARRAGPRLRPRRQLGGRDRRPEGGALLRPPRPAGDRLRGGGRDDGEGRRALAGAPGERWFVNRTRARADALAARFGGRALGLAELLAAPPVELDLLVTATAAAAPIIPPSVLAPALAARRPGDPALVVCDLGLPRDVDPAVDALPGVRVVDLATIEAHAREARARHAGEVARVREVVRAEAERLVRAARFRDAAREGALALVGERLAHLAPGDQEVLVRYAVGLAARLARQPDAGARRAG